MRLYVDKMHAVKKIGLVYVLGTVSAMIGSTTALGQRITEGQNYAQSTTTVTGIHEVAPIFSETFMRQMKYPVDRGETNNKFEVYIPVMTQKNLIDIEPSPFRVYDSGTILRQEAKKFIPRADFVATKVDIGEKHFKIGSLEVDGKIKLRSEGVVVAPTLKIPVLNAHLEPRIYNARLDEVNLRFTAFRGDGIISYKQGDRYPVTAGYVRRW